MDRLMRLLDEHISIQEALEKEYDVIRAERNISTGNVEVHLTAESFVDLINEVGGAATLTDREDDKYPHKVSFEINKTKFFVILKDEEKEELDEVITYDKPA